MATRDSFLQRVREAVAAGQRAGDTAPLPERGHVGYQGSGDQPLERFREMWANAGGQLVIVDDAAAACVQVVQKVQALQARRVLLGRGPILDTLQLAEALRGLGCEVLAVEAFQAGSCKEPFFAADVCISGVDYLLPETGSLVVSTKPTDPRSASLLAPVHIAIAATSQLQADLFDIFTRFQPERGQTLPACVTIITGPSKTGDIELKLVTGVHGPGEVHVILLQH